MDEQDNLLSTLIVIKFYSFQYNVLFLPGNLLGSIAAIKSLEDVLSVGSSSNFFKG